MQFFMTALENEPLSASQYAEILPTIGWIGLTVVVFYFFLIRPQKKREKSEKEMRSSLAVGDEICTIGGILGKIVTIKDDQTMIIESGAERTKIKINSWAIRGKEESSVAKTEK